ncbi:MAG: hypothetical protein IJZ30_04730 [Alphaproteobacteria bacterium]|nr:hypothetical protein [Alphaproteobacteria bacterium]
MFKFDIKKYLSIEKLYKFGIFVFVLFLTGCEDGETGEGADKNVEDQARCWQTHILSATLRIIDNLFSGASQKVSDGGPTLVMTAFAVWMGLKFLKVLPSFKGENTGEVMTEVGHKLFLCAFCAWIVSSTNEIVWSINTFLLPLYNAFLELASKVINVNSSVTYNLGEELGSITFSNPDNASTCKASLGTISGIREKVLPMANCLVCSISTRLNVGIKIGVTLLCHLKFSSIIIGITMLLIFTFAKFAFVLFVVDAMFRLNFAVVLMPLMIMGIPFSYTRKWSVWTILMFLNSSGVMLFLGLLVGLSVNSLETIMVHVGHLITVGKLDNGNPVLLSIFMISLLLLNLPGLGVALADKFIEGGGDIDFQKKISKFVIDMAKKSVAAIASAITSGASKAVTDGLEKYEKTRDMADTVKQKANAISNKLNEIAGYNDD